MKKNNSEFGVYTTVIPKLSANPLIYWSTLFCIRLIQIFYLTFCVSSHTPSITTLHKFKMKNKKLNHNLYPCRPLKAKYVNLVTMFYDHITRNRRMSQINALSIYHTRSSDKKSRTLSINLYRKEKGSIE